MCKNSDQIIALNKVCSYSLKIIQQEPILSEETLDNFIASYEELKKSYLKLQEDLSNYKNYKNRTGN